MTGSRPVRARWRAGVLAIGLAIAVAGGGCASAGVPLPMRPSPGELPPGSPLLSRSLPDGDAWLRHHLMRGDADAALDLLRRSAARPGDRLLQALQEAVVLHHAGRYAESNRRFEWAEQEAERRLTRSVRQNVGAVLINEGMLAYLPSAGEMAVIPYYRMLNYMGMGLAQSAAVEARKASAYVARLEPRQDRCQGFGLVQYMAGHVFAAAGEANDALVSMRQAERSFTACGGPAAMPAGFATDLYHAALAAGLEDIADEVAGRHAVDASPRAADEADLIVLIEHGFAAHRVQQALHVPIWSDEIGSDGEGASAAALASLVTARIATSLLSAPESHRLWDDGVWQLSGDRQYSAGSSPRRGPQVAHVLRLAWPVARLEASRAATARIVVDGERTDAPALEDVSARVVAELESRRNAILARTVARGVVKYLATREVEEQAENRAGEIAGALVGMAANSAFNALERADTRTWSLLPDQIAVARVRVPAGERRVSIEVLDSRASLNRIVDLGTITLKPGERLLLSERVWGADAGDRDRLMRLGAEVYERSEVPTSVAVDPPPPRARGSTRRRPQNRPVTPVAMPPGVPPHSAPPPPLVRPPAPPE